MSMFALNKDTVMFSSIIFFTICVDESTAFFFLFLEFNNCLLCGLTKIRKMVPFTTFAANESSCLAFSCMLQCELVSTEMRRFGLTTGLIFLRVLLKTTYFQCSVHHIRNISFGMN